MIVHDAGPFWQGDLQSWSWRASYSAPTCAPFAAPDRFISETRPTPASAVTATVTNVGKAARGSAENAVNNEIMKRTGSRTRRRELIRRFKSEHKRPPTATTKRPAAMR